MSPEPVGAVGRASASGGWRRKALESDGAFYAEGVETASALFDLDSAHLSPLAQLVSTLEALEESDPAQYTQVTRQIGENLLAAARLAGSRGDSAGETAIGQLAADFSAASGSGQLQSLLNDLTRTAGPGDEVAGAEFLAFVRKNESQSAENAAIAEAAVYVRTVSAVVFDDRNA